MSRPAKTHKSCPRCGETDLAKFGKNRSRTDGLTLYCKACKAIKQQEDTAKHRDKRNAHLRDYRRSHTKQRKPKACPQCGETDLTMFSPDSSKRDGLAVYCIVCKTAKNNAWYAAHKNVVSRRRKTKRDRPA